MSPGSPATRSCPPPPTGAASLPTARHPQVSLLFTDDSGAARWQMCLCRQCNHASRLWVKKGTATVAWSPPPPRGHGDPRDLASSRRTSSPQVTRRPISMSVTECGTVKGGRPESQAGCATGHGACRDTHLTSSDNRCCRVWPKLHNPQRGQSGERPGAGARLTRTPGSAPCRLTPRATDRACDSPVRSPFRHSGGSLPAGGIQIGRLTLHA